jgi:DNA-binding NarL/FixJ family response regulator
VTGKRNKAGGSAAARNTAPSDTLELQGIAHFRQIADTSESPFVQECQSVIHNANRLRILLADDHEVVRRGVRAILKDQSAMQVVGEAVDGVEAVELATRLRPDVAILDIEMPRADGLVATRKIREIVPQTQILILTIHESDEVVRQALEAGARGLVMKSDLADRLGTAITAVARGEAFFTPKVTEIMLNGFLNTRNCNAQASPTPREIDTIRLLANGKANKEVAAALGITLKTAETYRARIMMKLNLHSLPDLTRYAIRQKLIES